MTEHEKLKEICDKIGYKNEDYSYMFAWDEFMDGTKVYETGFYKSSDDGIAIICDVREIIFTQEFMEKFTTYYCFTKGYVQIEKYYQYDILDIFNYLDNPVDYLYNILTK